MILQRRSRGLLIFHGGCQLLIAELLFIVFVLVAPMELVHGAIGGINNYALYALVVGFAIVIDIARCVNRNVPLLQLSTIENIRRSGRQAFTILVALLLVLVASKDTSISRLFLFGYVAAYYVVSLVVNRVLPPFLAASAFGKRHQKRTVILGDVNRGQNLLDWLDDRSAFGIKVVGFLETSDRTPLEQRLREHGAQQLILLGLPKSTARMGYYCRACERAGTRLMVMSDTLQEFGRSITIDEHEELQFISFHRDVLECPYNRLLKRLFDISIALPVSLFVLPPLAVIVWILHRVQAPGPLFFRQTRTGADGVEFSIFKFRTMRVHNEDESRQATNGDPRIFAAGGWLRKTSLDEIPQFLNVLLGEMSIVGPRPHLKAHDDQFAEAADAYRFRQFIKPGITGLAQVTGFRGETREDADIRNRVQADIEYLEKWSLGLDFSIVCRTAWQMIVPPKSAY